MGQLPKINTEIEDLGVISSHGKNSNNGTFLDEPCLGIWIVNLEKNYEPKCWHRVVLSASTDHKWLSMVYTNKGAESPKQNYPSLNVI